jgi:putative endopeptidase
VNGKLTLGENIADLGGIHIAYDALKSSMGSKGMGKRIGSFTEEQRFFIAWAQIWKNNTTEDLKKLLVTSDPHSPAHVRGSLPVLTHERFEDAFAEKSKLKLPKEKYNNISLW